MKILYQDSESNKAHRDDPNKSTKAIQGTTQRLHLDVCPLASHSKLLENYQDAQPDNLQVKVLSMCQSVYQIPSQLESKEGTHLEC